MVFMLILWYLQRFEIKHVVNHPLMCSISQKMVSMINIHCYEISAFHSTRNGCVVMVCFLIRVVMPTDNKFVPIGVVWHWLSWTLQLSDSCFMLFAHLTSWDWIVEASQLIIPNALLRLENWILSHDLQCGNINMYRINHTFVIVSIYLYIDCFCDDVW